jgi:aspartyl-tRNA synthetase
VGQALVFRGDVTRIIREEFEATGFTDVETPLLMKTTPEGARDYIVPSRLQPGKVYALPQSPQLLKQTLMIAGIDRYYQICKCLRDEDLRADRQPEFTQLDMEMSFVERDDVFAVIEKTVNRLYRELLDVDLPDAFPRMTYAESMERFGTDKPDTRFGLELVDCSAPASSSGFKVFSGAVEAGGSVRCIRVPGGESYPRKKVDALEAVAKEYGARGLAWCKLKEEGLQGPIAKFLSDDDQAAILSCVGAEQGDLLVFVADQNPVVFAALSAVRLAVAEQLDLIDRTRTDVLWVTDFPLFEQDEETGQWTAMHHMFTSPSAELPEVGGDLSGILGNQYDLVINGNELGSGSIRIHNPEIQRRVFQLIGLSDEEVEAKFGWFVNALDFGAPPHGGVALGIDRLIMVMLQMTNIRDVIAFPKNSVGVCPMTDSPSEAVGDAFEVVGLQLLPQPEPEA